MHDRIVRPSEVEGKNGLAGLSGMHIRRLEEAGIFPKRFKLCPDSGKYGACGWLMSTIQAYLKKRAATVGAEEKPP